MDNFVFEFEGNPMSNLIVLIECPDYQLVYNSKYIFIPAIHICLLLSGIDRLQMGP